MSTPEGSNEEGARSTNEYSFAQEWIDQNVGRDHAKGPAVDALVHLLRATRAEERHEAQEGVAEDGSVGFDLRHEGRSLGAVTFASDGAVEIVIARREPRSPVDRTDVFATPEIGSTYRGA